MFYKYLENFLDSFEVRPFENFKYLLDCVIKAEGSAAESKLKAFFEKTEWNGP